MKDSQKEAQMDTKSNQIALTDKPGVKNPKKRLSEQSNPNQWKKQLEDLDEPEMSEDEIDRDNDSICDMDPSDLKKGKQPRKIS